MQSLVVTVPGLKWGDDDNKNAMVGRALTYLVLYSTLGMIVRWSYGVRLLSQADPETQNPEPEQTEQTPLLDSEETAFPPSQEEYQVFHRNQSGDSTTVTQGNPSIHVHDTNSARSDPKFFYSFPNSPYNKSQGALPRASGTSSVHSAGPSDDDEADDMIEFPARRQVTPPTSSLWQSRMRRLKGKIVKMWRSLSEFMTAPLWAALLSLIVACIPPFQHALEVHVKPIKGALTQAGNCSIPLTLVVLGAYFYSPPEPEADRSRAALPSHARRSRSISTSWSHTSLVDNIKDMFKMKKRSPSDDPSGKAKKRPGETKTVVIAVLSRMIITPLLLLPVMALSTRFNLQEVFDEYVIPTYFWFYPDVDLTYMCTSPLTALYL